MDGFTDLLAELKEQGGPLWWIIKSKKFLENLNKSNIIGGKDKKKRSPDAIKQAVLNSDRLKHCIEKIIESSQQQQSRSIPSVNRGDVQKEAKQIIDEMAHNFDLKVCVYILDKKNLKKFKKI
jgi:hypothetical protein